MGPSPTNTPPGVSCPPGEAARGRLPPPTLRSEHTAGQGTIGPPADAAANAHHTPTSLPPTSTRNGIPPPNGQGRCWACVSSMALPCPIRNRPESIVLCGALCGNRSPNQSFLPPSLSGAPVPPVWRTPSPPAVVTIGPPDCAFRDGFHLPGVAQSRPIAIFFKK